jgi:hypothetical protein
MWGCARNPKWNPAHHAGGILIHLNVRRWQAGVQIRRGFDQAHEAPTARSAPVAYANPYHRPQKTRLTPAAEVRPTIRCSPIPRTPISTRPRQPKTQPGASDFQLSLPLHSRRLEAGLDTAGARPSLRANSADTHHAAESNGTELASNANPQHRPAASCLRARHSPDGSPVGVVPAELQPTVRAQPGVSRLFHVKHLWPSRGPDFKVTV